VDYAQCSPSELVQVCIRTGEEPAWQEFVRRFQPLIAVVVLRTARRWGNTSPDLLDDLTQETFLKLCADRETILQKFQPTHPNAMFGYIKVLTANLVHDYFKALHSQKRGQNLTSALSEDYDSDESAKYSLSGAEAIERNVLLGQIDTALSIVETGPNLERDRRIFWLYYRVGLSANAISAIPSIGLTTKGVESTLLRLTKHVKERLCQDRRGPRESTAGDKGIRPAESF
jgi:RNA polymerase sigma-70 factor (ECF subfamily)